MEFDLAARWKIVYLLQGVGTLRCLAIVSGITATYLGVCLLLEYFPRRAVRGGEDGAVRVLGAWRSLVVIQMGLIAVSAYLYYYKPLGYAVSTDDLALAEKRLNWNIEGLGPNNGLIVRTSASGLELFPLLPVAVRNGSYDMVTLLLNRGAELNPTGWDDVVQLESGTYVKSALYFAVRNHDVGMMEFLLDLGVNPEQGIYPALLEDDRELLGYFLGKGASLEFAMGVAKRMNYSQQRIDEVFAEYTAKIRGEAGQ